MEKYSSSEGEATRTVHLEIVPASEENKGSRSWFLAKRCISDPTIREAHGTTFLRCSRSWFFDQKVFRVPKWVIHFYLIHSIFRFYLGVFSVSSVPGGVDPSLHERLPFFPTVFWNNMGRKERIFWLWGGVSCDRIQRRLLSKRAGALARAFN